MGGVPAILRFASKRTTMIVVHFFPAVSLSATDRLSPDRTECLSFYSTRDPKNYAASSKVIEFSFFS